MIALFLPRTTPSSRVVIVDLAVFIVPVDRLGYVGLPIRENLRDGCVEDARRHKGEQPSDRVEVLRPLADGERRVDSVRQPGQSRSDRAKEGDERSPVDAGRVPVSALLSEVERGDVDFPSTEQPVVGHEETADGSEEAGGKGKRRRGRLSALTLTRG